MKIPQIQPWIDNSEGEYLKKILKKKYLTENFETRKFEEYFEKNYKINHALSISNWTNGIFCCLKALGIGKNDEVIIPNLTFVATANAIILTGAKPVLCDIENDNLSLDLNKIIKYINKNTKAIIPVHLYGHCCDMKKLINISKKYKIPIIEDAAQAISATYNNKYLGTLGLMGGFSFYGNKLITTGEGGIILVKNRNLRNKIYELKNHGRLKKGIFKHKEIGFNFMFTELQAAIGNIQLKKLNKIIKKKSLIFNFYQKELSLINNIHFMQPVNGNRPVHWFSNIFTNKKKELQKFLKKNNIETRDSFLPLNVQPCYKGSKLIKNVSEKFPISKNIYNTLLSLPSSYSLSYKQQKFVINKIKEFYKKN
jgi:perosamine synthetase